MSEHSPKQWFKLEEIFFNQVDQRLMEQIRARAAHQQSAEAIMNVAGISDAQLAAEIADLDITIETLSAFRLAPLVAVAWADDRVEENERYTILRAAEKSGIQADQPAMKLLENWTTRRPSSDLLDAWCDYARALAGSLSGEHRTTLRGEILQQVRAVAESSGGFLGFGSISPSEKEVIGRIEAALS